MKILWLVNVALPEASMLMGEKANPFGGWLVSTSKNLAKKEDIKLSIAFPRNNQEKLEKIKGTKINYYPFIPVEDKDIANIESNDFFERMLKEIKPDIVHIHGTELAQSVSMINMCNKLEIQTVISIQGLVSIIEHHLYSGLPYLAIYKRTIRNVIARDNVRDLRSLYKKRGKNEIKAIKSTKNIIGRTTWDKAVAQQYNPSIKYFHVNESLRDEFYNHKWKINSIEKHSIFLSQGQYPVKGFHYMLDAMPLILKKYPQAKIYVSGKDITKSDTVKDRLLMTYYGKYIKRKIKRLNLDGKIIFTGPLNEREMCQRFLKSNVFVSASNIENESNSLSEAKILGVPVVASYVGGVTERINHGTDGFHYQHDAPYMLAHYICEIFEDKELAIRVSRNARKNALKLHNVNENIESLRTIYNQILETPVLNLDEVENNDYECKLKE